MRNTSTTARPICQDVVLVRCSASSIDLLVLTMLGHALLIVDVFEV
jgi:hypothetical protein